MALVSISFRPGKYAPGPYLHIAPLIERRRYVKTSILSAKTFAHVESRGVQFAEAQDAGKALLTLIKVWSCLFIIFISPLPPRL